MICLRSLHPPQTGDLFSGRDNDTICHLSLDQDERPWEYGEISKNIFFIALLICITFPGRLLFSQNNDAVKNEVVDRLLESIAEQNGDEADYTNLVEWLDEYYYNPLNINTAKKEDLNKLVILDENQILE